MSWHRKVTWPHVIAVALALLTLSQLHGFLSLLGNHAIDATFQMLPIIGLWAGYFYKYAPRFRVLVIRLLAYLGNQRTSVSVAATFTLKDVVTANEVIEVIRTRYEASGHPGAVKDFPSGGRTIVEMPGWQARVQIDLKTSDVDWSIDQGEEVVGELQFVMPDTQNAIRSARDLLVTDVLPLFETFTQKLPLTLKSAQVILRFMKQPNPYLAAYLQNIDLEHLTTFRCVVREAAPHSETTISRDKVQLNATTVADIRNLTEKHLALQWGFR